jgi:acetate kinase
VGGLYAIVFATGIREHKPPIPAAVAERLSWLGLELDQAANATYAARGSRDCTFVPAFVMPTDEETIIADETLTMVQAAG